MINLKFALRTLFKTPFVTIVAIVSLALGIGANAAIFSCFNQILLEPLPVPEPDRLVNLAAPGPKPGSHSCNQAGDCDEVFSYPMFRDLAEACRRRSPASRRIVIFGANLSLSADRRSAARACWCRAAISRCSQLTPALGRLLDAGRRSRGRRIARRRAEPCVLAERGSRADPDVAQPAAHRQRTDADDRRRGAARLRRDDARDAGRKCSCRSRCGDTWSPASRDATIARSTGRISSRD